MPASMPWQVESGKPILSTGGSLTPFCSKSSRARASARKSLCNVAGHSPYVSQPTAPAKTKLMASLSALIGERHPGSSPDRLKSAEDYLAEEFSRFGLDVARHQFDAFGGTYSN